MDYYKIRIDVNDNRDDIVNFLDKYCTVYLIAFEGALTSNPHCHGYIETTTKQATIRDNIRRRFGKGNGSYSMKALDEQHPLEYLAYMIKDGEYINSGVPTEKLEEAKAHDLKVKEQMKEKKASRRTVLQQIEDEYFSGPHRPSGEVYRRGDIVDIVLEYYEKKGGLIRKFMIISLCDTLCCKYVPSYSQFFKESILDCLANGM